MKVIYCTASECDRIASYKEKKLCQKHYFRLWRYGTTELSMPDRGKEGGKHKHSAGYVLVRYPNHPLVTKKGLVYEHRKVIYDRYGDNLPPCEKCGADTDWHTRKTHIDHIDCNKSNNSPENLRVLCNSCNVKRSTKSKRIRTKQ
jgi:hypothetical protein